MRRGSALVAAVAGAGMLMAGCGSAGRPPAPPPGSLRGVADVEPAVSARPYAAADQAFGLQLLGAWCQHDPTDNIVLSPASIASGLGMAYLGARGTTAAAMGSVLHLPRRSDSLLAGLQARQRALASLTGPGVTVSGADRVWADQKLLPLRSYLNAVATGYGASVGRVPLLTEPARSAAEIDAAVAAATGGHITRLLSAQDLGQALFVLTDAMYLKARWDRPFSSDQVSGGQFTAATGQRVHAQYLSGAFAVATRAGWTAVSLPYQGGNLAMTALLPPGGTQQQACPDLTAAQLAALSSQLRRSVRSPNDDAEVEIPEVSLRDQASLTGLLTKLGMGIAFSYSADFAGMAAIPMAIGNVEHAATLRVDASGTTGSAATAVIMVPTAVEVPRANVNFDRPFLLMVSAAGSGEPLFLARVANPAAP